MLERSLEQARLDFSLGKIDLETFELRAAELVRNPYLVEFFKYVEVSSDRWCSYEYRGSIGSNDWTNAFMARERLTKQYAWAVPNDAALTRIAALDLPVVEMGAGTGYWASLLQTVGVVITAFDESPGKSNWTDGLHTEVEIGTPDVLEDDRWQDHTLLLCWPPYSDPMAYDSVKAFPGDTLVFIGEDAGGCTGGEDFWQLVTGETPYRWDDDDDEAQQVEIEPEWREEEDLHVAIPQWPGLHDCLRVFRRR